jgi:hypothetical protein
MGNLRPDAKIIYESPDKGETVYARYEGETDRWLVGQTNKAKNLLDDIREEQLWSEIRKAARSNRLLQEALDKAKVLYELSKTDES